jgi:hypothetical protein
VDEMAGRLPEERQMLELEMDGLEDSVPGLSEQYRLVDRLGEGQLTLPTSSYPLLRY